MSQAAIQRVVLWGLLVATVLAIAVTALMAPRWMEPARGAPPPVLGEVPPFELINRDGETVSSTDLRGQPWVADFIFTRCALSCPRMTALMVQLGGSLPVAAGVFRVSFSIDPAYDRPEVLQEYAETWDIEDSRWLFLTGETETIYRLVVEGFMLALDAEPSPELTSPEEPILHSNRFVLVDDQGRIRGYYNVVEGGELQRLITDLQTLNRSV